MGNPGRFHAETIAPFDIDPGQTVTIPLVSEGIAVPQFLLPRGDTDFAYEISDTELPLTVSQRPNRMELYIVRLHHDGVADDDRTGRAVRAISAPTHTHGPNRSVNTPSGQATVAGAMTAGASGTTNWADTFEKDEYVNVDDGPFTLRMTHNGSGKVRVGKFIVRATNDGAIEVYQKGHVCVMSDGSFSDYLP